MNSMKKYIVLFLLVFLLSGCGAIKRAREAKDETKIPAGERTITADEIGLHDGDVLSVEQAVAIAVTYNPAFIRARQNLAVAEAEYRSAVASYLPILEGRASYRRATNNLKAGKESNKSYNSYSAGLDISQLVFDFWKTPYLIKKAVAEKVSAQNELDETLNKLTYDVKIKYLAVFKAQKNLEVAQDALEQYRLHLEQAKAYFEVGRLIENDVVKAEVDYSNAQLTAINAQSNLKIAYSLLNQAMGFAEDVHYEVVEPPLMESSSDVETLMATARERNPQLKSFEAQVLSAYYGVDVSLAGLLPYLSFNAGLSYSGDSFPLVWNWYLGPSLNWSIFNGFRNMALIDEAVASLRLARAQKSAFEQQIYQQLSQSVAQLESAKKRMELTELMVKQARKNLELFQARQNVGRALAIEVTDAQVALSNARLEQISAWYDYQSASVLIEYLTGGKR